MQHVAIIISYCDMPHNFATQAKTNYKISYNNMYSRKINKK